MAEAPSVGVEDVWEQKKKTIYKQELSQLFGLTRFLLNSYKEARSGPASS